MDDIQQKISNYINREFLQGKEQLSGDTPLFALGILNSMRMVELVQFLEQTFPIEVEDHEYIPEYFADIDRITLFVKEKMSSSSTV